MIVIMLKFTPQLKYIVTGTGRCGTLYAANLLTSIGIPCSHEAIFTNQGLTESIKILSQKKKIENSLISKEQIIVKKNEAIIADSSYMAAPFLSKFQSQNKIHIVRHPKKVVKSFIAFGYFSSEEPQNHSHNPYHLGYEQFIYKHLPELSQKMPTLDRACLFYVLWNRMIEEFAGHPYRIEDESERLQTDLRPEFNGLPYDNSNCNSLHKDVPWEGEIESSQIRSELFEMAKRYGYDMED